MTAAAVLARLAATTVATRAVAGWAGHGAGTVVAAWDGDTLVLTEAGTWAAESGRPMRWRAVSRWRVEGEALAVEHLRQGVPASAALDRTADGTWVGREPHACGADCYAASLRLGPEAVEVAWTISGPAKDSRVVTRYTHTKSVCSVPF